MGDDPIRATNTPASVASASAGDDSDASGGGEHQSARCDAGRPLVVPPSQAKLVTITVMIDGTTVINAQVAPDFVDLDNGLFRLSREALTRIAYGTPIVGTSPIQIY